MTSIVGGKSNYDQMICKCFNEAFFKSLFRNDVMIFVSIA